VRLQLGAHRLEPVLDVLEGLVGGLPVVKLAQQLLRLGVQLRAHKVLLQDAAHDPGQDVRVRAGEEGRRIAATGSTSARRSRSARAALDRRCRRRCTRRGGRKAAHLAGRTRRHGRGLEGVRDGEIVDGGVVVEARVALARVEAASERGGELAHEAVVRDAEVAQLEGEADEVGDEVGGVDAPVDEDGAVDVGVASG